jgi:hypothetical protein
MARSYLPLRLLYELRLFLSKRHLEELAVGPDGYNRTMVSIFRSIAGQHQLSTNKFIVGSAAWIAATQQLERRKDVEPRATAAPAWLFSLVAILPQTLHVLLDTFIYSSPSWLRRGIPRLVAARVWNGCRVVG